MQARDSHPLFQLLATPPKQQQPQGQAPTPAERADGAGRQAGRQLYFPLQLSPAGARSLLFANFWVALLQPPFK